MYDLRELVNLTHIQEVKLVQGNVYDLQEIFPLRSWFSSVIDGVFNTCPKGQVGPVKCL